MKTEKLKVENRLGRNSFLKQTASKFAYDLECLLAKNEWKNQIFTCT